jgi:hypothetical protein
MSDLWKNLANGIDQEELIRLRRIRELALKHVSRFVCTCRVCGEIATLEAGDWSGSSFYCRPCYDEQYERLSTSTGFLIPDVSQNAEMVELYKILKGER